MLFRNLNARHFLSECDKRFTHTILFRYGIFSSSFHSGIFQNRPWQKGSGTNPISFGLIRLLEASDRRLAVDQNQLRWGVTKMCVTELPHRGGALRCMRSSWI